MSERLAEVRARIESVRQLGQVFNALGGMAAARAQAARGQLLAVDAYAEAIAAAIGRALMLEPERPELPRADGRTGLVVFLAEQGFAGAFSEQIFAALGPALTTDELFLVGSRGADLAAQRGVKPFWTGAAASHGAAAPKLADRIAEALFQRIAAEQIARLDVAFTNWTAGRGFRVERRRLFPLDPQPLVLPADGEPPLTQISAESLLRDLAADYLHAQLCHAALHSFAAENQARMEAMAAARRQADSRLEGLCADERRVRQDEITAEIIELSAGDAAMR
jgi:F-type H+-transporting ATPase subunit gamma